MSEDKPEYETSNPEVTPDTQAIVPAEASAAMPLSEKKPSNKMVWLVLLIQFLIILALCAAGAFFYMTFEKTIEGERVNRQNSITASDANITTLKGAVSELSEKIDQISSSALSELQQELDSTVERFATFEQSVAKINGRLSDLSPRDEQQWMVSQIEYFLKMAQYRMNLTGDNHGAALLLDQAGVVAAQLSSPDAQALIKAISHDRANLKIDGHWQPELIHAQLNALIEKISSLSVAAYSREDFNDIQEPTEFSTEGIGKVISKLVRVQKTDNSVKPLLDQTTRKQVEQHMFMLLTESQLNVMRQNQEGFNSALKQLEVLVAEAFNQNQKETMFFLEEITRLQTVQITKPTNTLDKSEQALRNLVQIFEKKQLSVNQG